MRTHRITSSLLLAAMLLSISGRAAAQTFNAASDFSVTANPNGAWSYGWSTSRGTAFNLFPYSGTINATTDPNGALLGSLDIWTLYGIPLVFHNGSPIIITGGTYPQGCCAPIPLAALGFHPGPNGENAVVRWTAPASGLYKVNAAFSGVDYGGNIGTTTDVAVLHNGIQLYAGNVVAFGSHYDQSFSGTVSVLAGDTIDFTVGYGMVASGNDFVLYPYANYYSDSTGLDAVITPESRVLTSDVTNLINGSNLNTTQKSQLSALVSAIETSLASGQKAAAIRNLQGLVVEIVFLMWSTPPLVPTALGDHLITDANEAIVSLRS